MLTLERAMEPMFTTDTTGRTFPVWDFPFMEAFYGSRVQVESEPGKRNHCHHEKKIGR